MNYHACKCGEAQYYDSGMPPQPCQGCDICGSSFNKTEHGEYKPREPHKFVIKYKDSGEAYELCTRCYSTGRRHIKMTHIPGSLAHHSWITDDCRMGRGNDGAVNEILNRAEVQMRSIMKGWNIGRGVKINLAVTIERPEEEPPTTPQIGMTTEDLVGE